eukprot:CAMPEP_0172464736 /NCGR_PEP_ID=MMETSP1065-20121228/51420_1 /TAXON_ID=265537 /ORGANISM="Amphiprora paludosa, Strain CCMP125" /LENGTH=342 /DNA_ID=CAMNT_0013221071 /DNA_START=69 /DNA_END=1097 /DNA_ORIENTATION=+
MLAANFFQLCLLVLLSPGAKEQVWAFQPTPMGQRQRQQHGGNGFQTTREPRIELVDSIQKMGKFVLRSPFTLRVAATSADMVDVANVTDTQEEMEASTTVAATTTPPRRNSLDMPWSELQEWALHDKISQYTITVPITSAEGTETMRSYTLWRAMTEDVPELAGYPLSFLVARSVEMRQKEKTKAGIIPTSPEILPFLDDFCFEPTGGLAGRIYGITGVADGTRIQTTPVADVQLTIPKRFVRTEDGQIIYELGRPAASMAPDGLSLEGGAQMADRVAASMLETTTNGLSNLNNANNQQPNGLAEILDPDLVNLAGLTAVVLAGAAAMGSLSHHLTVNVFWV